MLNPQIITLKNNLTVVLDYLPHVNSATLGVWSKIGSRIENLSNNGICHFLEHMVFKGTKNRNSFEISEQLESKGGYMNAYTSKEKTAWYAKVLKDDTSLAIDIVFDILLNSTFPADELEKEKGVIVEELKMYLDDPQDTAHNLYDKLCYNGNPLAYPIIGTEENIRSFSSEDFFKHIQAHYFPSKMVVVVSGNFVESSLLEIIHKHADTWEDKVVDLDTNIPVFTAKKELIVKKEIEQTNIVYGVKAYSYKSEDYYNAAIVNAILGGGMSSRLFVEIREKRGLAYFANSFLNSYADVGSFAVNVGCNADNANLVINLIKEEIHKAQDSIQDSEIEKAKNQLKSSILMSLESTHSRCERMASNILNYGEIKDLDKIIAKIDKVSQADVRGVLKYFNSGQETIAVVSNKSIQL